MYSAMSTFIDRLDSGIVAGTSVIDWSCPVPFFGDLNTARIATVGINPSNLEFVDGFGQELKGSNRRLPTLNSLGREKWSEIDGGQLVEIVSACRGYFNANPYDRWFRVLEDMLRHTSTTFYGSKPGACHIDLVPYATAAKWGSLPPAERRKLLTATSDALGFLLRDSGIQLLVLNGRSVVQHFEGMANIKLTEHRMDSWSLPRGNGAHIPGFAYTGEVQVVGGVHLPTPIRVLGYNHNLQSSFGVTGAVVANIARWLGGEARMLAA